MDSKPLEDPFPLSGDPGHLAFLEANEPPPLCPPGPAPLRPVVSDPAARDVAGGGDLASAGASGVDLGNSFLVSRFRYPRVSH